MYGCIERIYIYYAIICNQIDALLKSCNKNKNKSDIENN